jgi:hypothetical protein
MPDDYGTPEMFKVPARYKAPRSSTPGRITWSTHRGPRETCAFCILDIQTGVMKNPLATATRVATLSGRKWHLCKQHAIEVKQGNRKLPSPEKPT